MRVRPRAVVTGATGMLGSYLVGELLSAGHTEVTVMVRSLAGLGKIRTIWQAEGYCHDVTCLDIAGFHPDDEESVCEVFRGADTVYNCAAAVAIGGTSREEIIRTNTKLARTVSRAALKAGVRLLVHVSSVAALEPSRSGRVDADSLPGCGKSPNPYAESKYLSELEVAAAAQDGLQTVVVNPVTILGHGDPGHGSSAIIPFLARGIPFYPSGITGWVDARDVARAMVSLSRYPGAPGRRFVLCAENTPYRDLLSAGCMAAGKKKPRIPLPKTVARAASGTEKIYCRLNGRQRLFTPELISILYGRRYYDGSDIKNYITFDYSPLRETVERLVGIYLKSRK